MATEKPKQKAQKSEKKPTDAPKKTAANAAPETGAKTAEESQETAVTKKKRKPKRSVPLGHITVFATYNNTIVTVAEPNGNVLCWSTAGASGFKGTRKATPYAAQVAMENALTKAKVFGLERVHVFVKGIGIGRDQALRAIPQQGIDIESITDRTPVPHGGCRPSRARRV